MSAYSRLIQEAAADNGRRFFYQSAVPPDEV